MRRGSGEEQEHPKRSWQRGRGQREDQEVTAAKQRGSDRGKLMGWKKVQDPAGAARPLHQAVLVSQLGGGGSRGEALAGGCGAGAGCSPTRCSPRAPPPGLCLSLQVCNNPPASAGPPRVHERGFKSI